jgi:S-formylglutathione hydrolase FrmB
MRRALLSTAAVLGLWAGSAHAGQLETVDLPARGGEVVAQRDYPYAGPPKAKVLLPDGYDPAKRYPLVLLLHGRGSDHKWWVDYVKADAVLKDLNAVVVMPEAAAGWYTDWWNGGSRGAPSWETYMLEQVLPQVLERYSIRAERRYHAIVGVSMGGMGAT